MSRGHPGYSEQSWAVLRTVMDDGGQLTTREIADDNGLSVGRTTGLLTRWFNRNLLRRELVGSGPQLTALWSLAVQEPPELGAMYHPKSEPRLSVKQKATLDTLAGHADWLRASELAELLGMSTRRTRIRLRALHSRGLVERMGTGAGGRGKLAYEWRAL